MADAVTRGIFRDILLPIYYRVTNIREFNAAISRELVFVCDRCLAGAAAWSGT